MQQRKKLSANDQVNNEKLAFILSKMSPVKKR